MGSLANSEDPDEMPQAAAFHQGCTVCQDINQSLGTMCLLEIPS